MFILLSYIGAIVGLTAFLHNPVVLLALAFVPSLMQDLPFGLIAAQMQADAVSGMDPDDEAQPMGFTQNVQSKK